MSLAEKLKVYASVRVLRTLVDQTDNKPEAASAAWHAETYVRRLCATFKDPIKTMRFDGKHVLISISFPPESDQQATIAVGPWGTASSGSTSR